MKEMLKNKYVRRARISEAKFRKMVKYFADDLSATEIAERTSLNRNTVNRYLNQIRTKIVEFCENYAPFKLAEPGQALGEESGRIKLQRRLSTNLGLLKRRGKIYATMLANSTANTLTSWLTAQANKPPADLTIHAVGIKEEFGLLAIGYDNNHKANRNPSYVQNLEKFWNFVKKRTTKFHGLAQHKVYGHLKETEFRFNFRNDNLYDLLLELLRASPLE
jgi:predicted DNA-binding protein YlxM (UPF0122 family)